MTIALIRMRLCGNNEGRHFFGAALHWRRTLLFGRRERTSIGKGEKVLAVLTATAAVVVGIAKIVSNLTGRRFADLGCDWYCDNCGANMNVQPGFTAGGTWTCTVCGYENDVSTDNIVQTKWMDDGFGHDIEVIDIPAPGDWEDPEDY